MKNIPAIVQSHTAGRRAEIEYDGELHKQFSVFPFL